MVFMVKLTRKISTKQFVVSNLLILTFFLIFLVGLYYILNIQYQPSKNRFLSGPVTSLPKTLRIELDQPDDDALVFDPQIIVSGKTGSNLQVLISTDSSDLVVKSDPSGKFSTVLGLDNGPNNIKVVVFDQSGDSRSTERNVYYSKEKI